MTKFNASDRDVDRAIRSWLHEDRHEDASRLAGAVLDQVDTTPQRRATWWPARRTPTMNRLVTISLAAAAVFIGLVVGNQLLAAQSDGLGSQAPPTPGPTTAIDFPALTNTFVSPRNGFSVNHPDRAAITPAEQLWSFSQQDEEGFDVVETGFAAVFKGASTPTEFLAHLDGATVDERVDDHLTDHAGGCGVPRSEQDEISIDAHPGRVAECPNHIEATVLFGPRLYLFSLSHDRDDARAVFDAFVATIDLTPGTALDFPAPTQTFVSPTYGYSFGYFREITPATERWDPDDQPVEYIFGPDPRFDAGDTGLGASLEGASTPIEDADSIDDWVDTFVTPRAAAGCGVPRRQQEEITIDGQPARVAQCANQGGSTTRVEATVVAGQRLYLFVLYRQGDDARAMFDAWVPTIDLTPETAAEPTASPSP